MTSAPRIDRPLFIIGAPRSGTTVVFEAVASHPHFGWFPHLLNRFINTPLRPFAEASPRVYSVPGLTGLSRGEKSQGQRLSLFNRLLPRPDECYPVWEHFFGRRFRFEFLLDQTPSDAEIQTLRTALARLLRRQKKQRFAAKLTGPPRITFLRAAFPDARFLHVVRQPEAVVASLLNVGFWRERGGLVGPWWEGGLREDWREVWESHGSDPAILAALQWEAILDAAERESAQLAPEQYAEIRYEAFIENPQETLRTIFRFADLPPDESVERLVSRAGRYANQNARVNQRLTPEQRAALQSLLGDRMTRSGYAPATDAQARVPQLEASR